VNPSRPKVPRLQNALALVAAAAISVVLTASAMQSVGGSTEPIVSRDAGWSLFVSHMRGIDEYRPGTRTPRSAELNPAWAGDTVIGGDGTVWYAHLPDAGLWSFDTRTRHWFGYAKDPNDFWVTFSASGDGRVAAVDVHGRLVKEYARGHVDPVRVLHVSHSTSAAYDRQGSLWVTGEAMIARYDGRATKPAVMRALRPQTLTRGIVGGRDGRLYVIEEHSVLVLDRNAREVERLAVDAPQDIADDGRGNRYVADWRYVRGNRFSNEKTWDCREQRPISFETAGPMPPWESGRIAVFNAGGKLVRRLGPFNGIGSIAVDRRGRLYADVDLCEHEFRDIDDRDTVQNVFVYNPGTDAPIRRIKIVNDSFAFGPSSGP
jgi:hypothetical protein